MARIDRPASATGPANEEELLLSALKFETRGRYGDTDDRGPLSLSSFEHNAEFNLELKKYLSIFLDGSLGIVSSKNPLNQCVGRVESRMRVDVSSFIVFYFNFFPTFRSFLAFPVG